MKPNILFVLVDGLRADQCYGLHKESYTPFLDSLIKNGIQNKIINQNAIFESLIAFKRAGANAIVSYFANEIAKKIN